MATKRKTKPKRAPAKFKNVVKAMLQTPPPSSSKKAKSSSFLMAPNDLNNQSDQGAKDSGSNGAKDNPSDESRPRDQKDIGIAIVEIVGVGVCGILSNNFFSTDYKIAGIWFSLACLASLLALFPTLVKKPWRKVAWWSWGGVVSLVAVWFAVWTLQISRSEVAASEKLPRLTLALSGSNDASEIGLELTNEFFLKKRGPLKSSDVRGALLVPIKAGQTSAALSFALLNSTETTFDVARLQVESDFKPSVIFGTGWLRAPIKFPFTSSGLMLCDLKVPPPTAAHFPELTFSPVVESNRVIMLAHVGANGFESVDLAFWLVFSTKITKAHALEVGILFKDSTNFDLDIPNPEFPPNK